jgi:N-acyl homoserine lactone hydrolase
MENFNPQKVIKAMEMDVIPPGTHVNTYESYDTMVKIKEMADILLPLHEPKFASFEEIPLR